jgi:hypothetical protein
LIGGKTHDVGGILAVVSSFIPGGNIILATIVSSKDRDGHKKCNGGSSVRY